jgi:DNA-binding MarR family transcriptional regulator
MASQFRSAKAATTGPNERDILAAKDAIWIDRLVRVLEEFRKVNQDVTANQIVTFLHIAMCPGITQRELMKLTGLTDGTTSRLVAVLSDRGVRGRDGLDLVDIGFAEGDYRIRRQRLSARGRRVFDSIKAIME